MGAFNIEILFLLTLHGVQCNRDSDREQGGYNYSLKKLQDKIIFFSGYTAQLQHVCVGRNFFSPGPGRVLVIVFFFWFGNCLHQYFPTFFFKYFWLLKAFIIHYT